MTKPLSLFRNGEAFKKLFVVSQKTSVNNEFTIKGAQTHMKTHLSKNKNYLWSFGAGWALKPSMFPFEEIKLSFV